MRVAAVLVVGQNRDLDHEGADGLVGPLERRGDAVNAGNAVNATENASEVIRVDRRNTFTVLDVKVVKSREKRQKIT